MAEAPTPQGLLNDQSFGTIAPYEPNMVERAQGLLAKGFMKLGYDPRDAYFQANKFINTQGDMGAADFTPLAGDLIGAQDSYDMGVDAKRAFERDEYLKALGYGAGSAATGILSGLGVLGTVAPPVDKGIDAVRAGVKKATGLLDDVDDLGFYSPTERLATTLQPKGTGQQYLGILSKGDGKGSRIQEEMQDMGLDTWLQNKGKVSRDEVLDYIGDNRLRYSKEVLSSENPYPYRTGDEWQNAVMDAERRGDWDEAHNLTVAHESAEGYGSAGDTKYRQYAQTGGTGYQENLLTVPSEANKDIIIKEMEADSLGNPRYRAIHRQSGLEVSDRGMVVTGGSPDEVMRRAEATIEAEGGKAGAYRSPHYDQPNIGLTTRTQSFNTPDGNSVHLMDELQSDWHQAGKKKGYDVGPQGKEYAVYSQGRRYGEGFTQEQAENHASLLRQENPDQRFSIDETGYDIRGGVPNAPAKNSWINQGIKHELNNTIESGKDYFAWTGGDIQADRYSLRKQIDSIGYEKNTDGTYKLYLTPKGSSTALNEVAGQNMRNVPETELENIVGKEMANKITNDEYTTKNINSNFGEVKTIAGNDLEVGGEGMKSFYDKDVKKRTEKIIKRLDPNAKVEVIELDNGNKVWGVKITDKMRDKVKSEGMPLYSIAPIAGAGLLGAEMVRQEDQQPQQGILN